MFAVWVSSSSESSTAGRRELVEAVAVAVVVVVVVGGISGPRLARLADSDEPWPWRAIRETRGHEPDDDMSGCIEYGYRAIRVYE